MRLTPLTMESTTPEGLLFFSIGMYFPWKRQERICVPFTSNIAQSNPVGRKQKIDSIKVAGKTGTPQRILKGNQINDGWYVFFGPTPSGKSNTVVCVRIEEGHSSANAVKLANEIIPVLLQKKYISSF